MKRLAVFIILLFPLLLPAQVVTVTPSFPTITDTITITYYANQGNGALNNFNDSVFIHTGVINNFSGKSSNWRFIKTLWAFPDSTVHIPRIAPNTYRITFRPTVFYGMSNNERVRALAMVFRNRAGTQVGKNADNSDIFIPIYRSRNLAGNIVSPVENGRVVTVGQNFQFRVRSNQSSFINLYRNGSLIAQQNGTNEIFANITVSSPGKHWLKYVIQNANGTVRDSTYYVVRPTNTIQNPPPGIRSGINYHAGDTSVTLLLVAPFHDHVYVIGDFNNWEIDNAYLMNKTTDGNSYWLRINGLPVGQEVRYQFFVDDEIRVGDPMCDKILEQGADAQISPVIFPNLIPYPDGKTAEKVSILQTAQQPYNWAITNFQKPDSRDLVIYELLVRDFVPRHDYKSIIDSIKYLKKLGINAVEFMPWTEFEGNNSWGYSPTFFLAVDKYYGPKNTLKQLIDTLHANGIAVILDIVFNHCFGPSPYARLWWNESRGEPALNSPYCNVQPTHPFNVGYDMNHESPYVQAMVDTVLSYWAEHYKIDGYRFDLSKGLTQTYSGTDVGAWGNYDQSRVNIINRMVNKMWQSHPGLYAIMEHFGGQQEEATLAGNGCMFWGKATHEFSQMAMGYQSNSDFNWGINYQARNFPFHNLVGFAESHDEERVAYATKWYGNSNGSYNTRDVQVLPERAALVAPFLMLTPGPKMLWQFEELAYDTGINYGGRTAPKPNRWWEYYNQPKRQYCYNVWAAVHKLKRMSTSYRTSSFNISAFGLQKQLYVNDNQMNTCVIGNMDVVPQNTYTGFQHTGNWYNYFTGETINVTDVGMTIPLQPGEFRVFTDQPMPVPDMSIDIVGIRQPSFANVSSSVFPNPFEQTTMISFRSEGNEIPVVRINDITGKTIRVMQPQRSFSGNYNVEWNGENELGQVVQPGYYFYQISGGDKMGGGKLVFSGR